MNTSEMVLYLQHSTNRGEILHFLRNAIISTLCKPGRHKQILFISEDQLSTCWFDRLRVLALCLKILIFFDYFSTATTRVFLPTLSPLWISQNSKPKTDTAPEYWGGGWCLAQSPTKKKKKKRLFDFAMAKAALRVLQEFEISKTCIRAVDDIYCNH